ncbi:MAG: Gfo/Idh/MocA family protein [Planctomycetota bacterium]
MSKLRYAVVGTGGRCLGSYLLPLTRDYADTVQFVGLCDLNTQRMKYSLAQMKKENPKLKIPLFTDYAKMLKTVKPDRVLVTTRDSLHAPLAVQAMEAGADVVTEKPMTTDETMCRQILETEKKTRRKVTVTFNMRYGMAVTKCKELIRENHIGKLVSVDLNYWLDTIHGADYFRRWHRKQANSGSLLIHKSTHHFDTVNWLIEQDPVQVFAYGARNRYGKEHAIPGHGKNCRECKVIDQCPFAPQWGRVDSSSNLHNLYFKAEAEDGYQRDSCVFDSEVDIPDTMILAVRYTGGVHMSYSLNAFLPYEGFRLSINGTEGKIDLECFHRTPWDAGENTVRVTKTGYEESRVLTIAPYNVNSKLHGGHGGADDVLLRDIFGSKLPNDPLKRAAGSRAGAMSMLIGAAANNSMRENRPINIADLVPLDLINHRERGYH